MTKHVRRLTLLVAALGMLPMSIANADTSSEEILQGFGVSKGEIEQLENGEILAYSDEQYEFTKRELSADAMIRVNADMSAIMQALQDDPTLIPRDVTTDSGLVQSEADFDGVEFVEADIDEVEKLFAAKPGKKLNFSNSEYATLRQLLKPYRSAGTADKLKAASDAMRVILIGRYNEYRAKGLSGIAGYQRSRRKQVDVGAELQLTTDAFKPFENDFPEFVKVMSAYPDGADCCEHVFRWVKVKIRKRPAFALSHTIIQANDEFALITERVYYVNAQLNSVQITTAWLPYAEGGYLGLAMSASADILDSTMGRLLRPIGRNKAKDLVTGVMQETRADLETLSESPE